MDVEPKVNWINKFNGSFSGVTFTNTLMYALYLVYVSYVCVSLPSILIKLSSFYAKVLADKIFF